MRKPFIPMMLIALLAWSCKPAGNGSEAQSLDNFAGGDFTLNSCEGTQARVASDAQIVATSEMREEVRSALSAVPVSLKRSFFGTLKGKVILTNKIAAACTDEKGVQLEAGRDLVSCWQTPTPSSVAIYIKRDSSKKKTIQNIRHATVRSFGYMLSQFMLRLAHSPKGTVLRENKALDAVKTELAIATILNIAVSSTYELADLKSKVDAAVLVEGLNRAQRRAAWERVKFTPESKAFADYVLAESFDSYYCSAETKAKLAADFSLQGADVYRMMEDLGDQIVESFAADSSQPRGMSLWGRWGFGNGPLRSAFRGWGNWRRSGRGLFNFRRARSGGGFIFNRGGLGASWF